MRENLLAFTVGENARLSVLLKDYEDRIESEIDGRHRIMKEKNIDINTLHSEINKHENSIAEMQHKKENQEEYYNDEIQRYKKLLMNNVKNFLSILLIISNIRELMS